TTYKAQKLYQKISRILREKSYLPLWYDFTIIKWEHEQQFAQFNLEEHSQILKQIAKVLKKSILVDENLYYLGNGELDRKSTRLNSSHVSISYAVFCLKKKKKLFDNNIEI